MATLSFNPSRLKHTSSHAFTNSTKLSFHLSQFSSSKPPINNKHSPVLKSPADWTTKKYIQLPHCTSSVSESSVFSPPEENSSDQEDFVDDPTAELTFLDPEVDPQSITEWEIDFCSRPILDIRGKKIWELVVCDESLSLQYTKYFPNNVINSVTLKNALVSICDELGVPLPEKIRFFRSQMQTIISRACNELGVKPVSSRRCLSLVLWLEERYETVYTRHPGFQKGSKPILALDNPFPMELPENLYGEKWAFVQLPFSAVREEVSSFETKFVFGATLDLELLGIDIDENTLIPGLAVATSRAQPLAAWMNGLEVCSVEADVSKACLILSAGISTRYIYATYKKSPVTTSEAEAWEAAKRACGGLHFLAIQENLDSDDCIGFWLLLDLPPPPV